MYCTRSNAAGAFLGDAGGNREVLHVLAAFVEVERIPPVRDAAFVLGFLRDPVHGHHAVHVPVQVVAVELDLEVREAVAGDPVAEVLGMPSRRPSSHPRA